MSLVTLTILKFASGDRRRAFANMGRWMMKPFEATGLQFQKMMGTGKDFSLMPDFSQYIFLGVWDDDAASTAFFASESWQPFLPKDPQGTSTFHLQPFKSHGLWDGVNPFATPANTPAPDPTLPVAVLTRASIRTGALIDFYRNIPAVRQRLTQQGDNLVLAIGSGEKPLVQQCTISIWRNAAAIDQFAYRESGHKEVVKKTRARRWYTEELFARFAVVKIDGLGGL